MEDRLEVRAMNRAKQLMEEKGWSVYDLAAKLGATPRLVQRFLDGESKPRLISWIKMSLLFNVSLDYLIGLSDERKMIKSARKKADE